jgi:hypothetical protein
MLIKRTITNRDFYTKENDFTILSVIPYVEVNKVILKVLGEHDFTKSGQLILFRTLDDGDYFKETFEVTSCSIDKKSGITTITIKYNNLFQYFLQPSSINRDKIYCCEGAESYIGTELVFSNKKHICIYDRGIIDIKRNLNCEQTFSDLGDNFCNGYVLYDNKILYYVSENSADELNIMTHKLIYDNVEYDTIVPFSMNGYDNRIFMLILDDGNVEFDINKNFIVRDCRFFEEIGGEWSVHPNTVVRTIKNTINISLPLSSEFNNNLYHSQLLEDYADEIKDSYVVKPLDYEKTMFSGVYYNEDGCFDLNSIRFNIFLRKRHFFEDTMEWKLAKSYTEKETDSEGKLIDIEKWEEDEDAYWNSYVYDEYGNGDVLYSGRTMTSGDLLGDLGFDDNDALNQNKRLGKTFIRLLFFDSKDRATQTLLYYSTIFINTVDLYSKYINNITTHQMFEKDVKEYVYNTIEDVNLREKTQLSCNFTCYSKYNMTGSSEGYYIYLFPSLIESLKDENGESEIYMRVEFNHAKYGKTIPMVEIPAEGDGEPGKPRINYTEVIRWEDGKTKIVTDLRTLYDNMYIPIKIKYCHQKKGYVWYFSQDKGNNPIFNLWEPKIR